MVRATVVLSGLFAWGCIQDSVEYDERPDERPDERSDERRIFDGLLSPTDASAPRDGEVAADAAQPSGVCAPGMLRVQVNGNPCTCWTDARWRCVDMPPAACFSGTLSEGREPIQPCFDDAILAPECRITTLTRDQGEGSEPLSVKRFTYDAAGRLIDERFEDSGGGASSSFELSYSASDRIEGFALQTPSFTRRTTLTYEESGNLSERRTEVLDATPDAPQQLYRYQYNGAGQRVQIDYDATGDGTANLVWHYTYDDQGRVASRRSQDELKTYEYDEEGELLTPGVRRTYDGEGRVLSIEVVDSNDDVVSRTSFSYAPESDRITSTIDNGADGTIEYTTVYLYDAETRQWSVRSAITEDDMNGTLTAYTFDVTGQLSVKLTDQAGDGRLLNRELRSYDCTPLGE